MSHQRSIEISVGYPKSALHPAPVCFNTNPGKQNFCLKSCQISTNEVYLSEMEFVGDYKIHGVRTYSPNIWVLL